jgi:hypothetical protein
MLSYEELGIAGLIGRFIKGGVLPDRVNALSPEIICSLAA